MKSILKAVRSAKDSKTQISIGAQPVNEFTDFAKLLSGGFPVEFPLGVTDTDLGGPGPIQQRVLLRLLKMYDGRVAKNPYLLLWLTNMRMRHSTCGNVSARAKRETSSALVNVLNSEQFIRDCTIAEQNPNGSEARALVRQLGPLIRLAGSKVPWGPLERLSASYHLYSMYHIFGYPAFFITFAPKVLDSVLVLRFGQMQSQEGPVELELPENLQHKVRMLSNNTVAQARAYALIVEAVAEVLFGLAAHHTKKKTHKPVSCETMFTTCTERCREIIYITYYYI